MIKEINSGKKVSIKYPNNLKSLRREAGLKIDEVHLQYGCAKKHYTELEAGRVPLSATARSKLSEMFQVPEEDLDSPEEIEVAGLTINLGKLQDDVPKIVRIYDDGHGGFAIGAGAWLVAEVHIPARAAEGKKIRVPVEAAAVDISLWGCLKQ